MNSWYNTFREKWQHSNWQNVRWRGLLPVSKMEWCHNQIAWLHSCLLGSDASLTGCFTINQQGARPNVQLPWMVKLALHMHRTIFQLCQLLQTANIQFYWWESVWQARSLIRCMQPFPLLLHTHVVDHTVQHWFLPSCLQSAAVSTCVFGPAMFLNQMLWQGWAARKILLLLMWLLSFN